MKITLFTSNSLRHKYLVYLLSKICSKLYVIQENKTLFPGKLKSRYKLSKKIEKYFDDVKVSEKKLFKIPNFQTKNIKYFQLAYGDLSFIQINELKEFLKSDLYIVFGASFIKGKLLRYLIKKKAINIHMGVSPFYRGTDCNFWALLDLNPHLVGATVHMLSKSIDGGKVLFHAFPFKKRNPFDFTMLSVMAAFKGLQKKIKNKEVFKIKPITQKKSLLIRYSKKKDFNELALKHYKNLKKKIFYSLQTINRAKIENNLTNPFILTN